MIIKKTHLATLLPLLFVFCSFICLMKAENTSAYSIKKVTLDKLCIPKSQLAPGGSQGKGTCDPAGRETWFDLTVYGEDFDDYDWVEHCHCIDPELDFPQTLYDAVHPNYGSTSISLISGNLYRVTFRNSKDTQRIQCTMRIYGDDDDDDDYYDEPEEPEYYTLDAYAVDTSGNYITTKRIDYHTVEEGDKAYVDRKDYSKNGYEFQGWKSCKKSTCSYIGLGTRYSKYLYDDETVYAVYAKEEQKACDTTRTSTRNENGTVTISGSTSAEVNGTTWSASKGVYQVATDGEVEIKFNHTLSRSSDGAGEISEQYGFNTNSGSTGTIASGKSLSPTNTIKKTVLPLLANEDTQFCEYVGFKPKTWSFTRTYTDIYDVYQTCTYLDGVLSSTEKTGEKLKSSTSTTSAPKANSDNGQSTNTCVTVHRPWNFKITGITPNNSNGEKIVYAGSTISANDLKFNIAVAKNNNSYLITDIPNVNFTVVATLKDKNGKVLQNLGAQELDGTFRISPDGVKSDVAYLYYANRDNYNATYMITSESVNVPDTKAGNRLCFQLTANRNNSGNGYASNFSGNTTSSETCYTIAKHPTFQVWGGNFYTAGKVDAYDFAATKNNVNGDNSRPYSFASANDNDNAISFNPWVELAVVAGNGNVEGLSSGAATAYSWSNGFTQNSNDFCNDHSPLSIAKNCSNATLTATGAVYGESMKALIYNRYIAKATRKDIETVTGVNSFETLGDSVTRVAYNESGDIAITGNVIAYNTSYQKLSEIPAYIIYAKNINIACGVSQIDAILIADGGAIDTCHGDDDKNSSVRSNQLTINGLVIADKLILGRTYGAAYGQNSNIPAEIFNLSPMFYLWSGNETSKDNSRLYTTYLRELAPRY